MPEKTALPPLQLIYLSRPLRQSKPAGEKPPLLLLLHGVGSNERDLFTLASRLPPQFQVLSLRAPLVRAPDSYAWFDVTILPNDYLINPEQLQRSRDTVLDLISQAAVAFDADPARVYLLGFSQGAILSLTLGLTQPEPIAGIVALAGRIPAEVQPWAVAPERTQGLPVFLAHGRLDTVIPFGRAELARDFLEERRVALTFRPYQTQHRIPPDMLADAVAWLEEQLAAPRWQPNQPM